jgi:hypothetical protein
MRSRVCTFQFLPGIASAAFLRSESQVTQEHILLSLFLRLPQPGGPGSCIYFPQEQGSPVIPPGIGLQESTEHFRIITTAILDLVVMSFVYNATFRRLDSVSAFT